MLYPYLNLYTPVNNDLKSISILKVSLVMTKSAKYVISLNKCLLEIQNEKMKYKTKQHQIRKTMYVQSDVVASNHDEQ